jgi:hypothetical protein
MSSTKGLKTSLKRRRLVGGLGFEKMKVATVVGTYESYPTIFPSTFESVCPYSH